jgi:hypothetical protein
MYLSTLKRILLVMAIVMLVACGHAPQVAEKSRPEILTIFPDGSMKLEDRLIPAEDVVIYPDGYGGEKAAVKVRLEPLHPAFYRDSIVVRRIVPTLVTDN